MGNGESIMKIQSSNEVKMFVVKEMSTKNVLISKLSNDNIANSNNNIFTKPGKKSGQ